MPRSDQTNSEAKQFWQVSGDGYEFDENKRLMTLQNPISLIENIRLHDMVLYIFAIFLGVLALLFTKYMH